MGRPRYNQWKADIMKTLRPTLCLSLVPALLCAAPGPSAAAAAAEVLTDVSSSLRTGPVLSVKTATLPGLNALPNIDPHSADLSVSVPSLSVLCAAPVLARDAVLPQAALAAEPKTALAPVAEGVAPVLRAIARPEAGSEVSAQAGENVVAILQGGRASAASDAFVPSLRESKTASLPRAASARSVARRSLPKAFFGGAALTLGVGASGGIVAALIALPLMAASFVLHEVAHARAAYLLGDPGPILDNRGSLRPKDWATHLDPVWTLVVPVATFLATHGHGIMGGAKPVEFESDRFLKTGPLRGAAIAGFAGPAVNIVLAGLGALAFAAVTAAAAPALLVHAVGLFAVMNAAIAAFNLVPLYPLDGHFVAYAFMPKKAAATLKEFYKNGGALAWVPAAVFIGVAVKFGLMAQAVHWLAQLLLGAHGAGVLGL